MAKTHDLVVKLGEYTDRHGQTKAKWLNIGAVFDGQYGPFIVLEPHINLAALPRKDGGGVMVSMFDKREDAPQGSRGAPPERDPGPLKGGSDFDDDIPF